jgi:predicted dehydrogenase
MGKQTSSTNHELNSPQEPTSPSRLGRRSFLAKSAVGLGATLGAPSLVSAVDRNETVRVAVIGVRGRGGNHVKGFPKVPGVEIATLCDVDASILEKRAGEVRELQKSAPNTVEDFRHMLDDKSIDAVVVATPDHWHAPATIWACQAGKDVYVEKPCAHNLHEAQLMLKAARKYGRVVQHGTQSRSAVHVQDAVDFLQSGGIGRILQAKAINAQRRSNIGHKADAPVPAGLNYDLWLGPAPKRPFNPNRFHYNWHWFWDYGTGDMGNDGVHQIDIAYWALGEPGLPNAVSCGGGKYYFDDDQETPDTQTVIFEFDDKTLVFEMRLWTPYPEHTMDNGNVFYGEDGYMLLHRSKRWEVYFKGGEKGPSSQPKNDRGLDHRGDFISCVRSRKRPVADIEKGVYSSALALLGNLSYRLKRRLEIDKENFSIVGDPEANALLRREYRKGFEVSDTV